MRVIVLFKSGGDYKDEHVEMLRAQLKRYNPEAELICIGDDDLDHGWSGWWSKIELFKIQGPVLFLDLDTIIVGDMTAIFDAVHEHDFLILRDFSRGKRNRHAMQSSIMGWRGDKSFLYEKFKLNADEYMKKYHGDQNFIEDYHTGSVTYFQDILPNVLQSFKADVRVRGIHPDCKAVIFHGKPRPWEQDEIKCK